MRTFGRALLLWTLLGAGVASAAPEVKVTAAFSALEIRPDDLVSYTVTLSGERLAPLQRTPHPDFSDFQVASGPSRSTSSSFNMRSGRAQTSKTLKLTWQVMPKRGREGELRVPGFEILVGSQSLRVPPSTVESSFDAAPRRRSSRGGSSSLDPFARDRRRASLEDVHLEVRERISGRTVYLGEEVILTHVLEFGNGAVVRTFDPEPAVFPGFEKQDRKVEHQARRVSGQDWQEVPLAQWRLVPLTVGKREISARGYVLHLQARSRDIFEGFFGGAEKQARRATRPIALVVKRLPPGAPRDFSGAVGNFQVESKLGSLNLNQGDGTTLKLVVRGTGNFSAVSAPDLRLPAGVRAFDPEVRLDTRPGRDGRTTGSKIFEYPLLIESSGQFRFEPVSWSYFDPKSGRYVTRKTRPLRLDAAATARTASSGGPRTSLVETLDTDIHHLVSDWLPVPERRAPPSGLPAWFWPALIVGPLLPVAGALVAFSRRRSSGDESGSRSKKAAQEAKRRLAVARAAAKGGDGVAAADAAAAAVSRFVVERCGGDAAEPAAAEVVALVSTSVGPELAERVRLHLADCDFLRFAGASTAAAEGSHRVEEAKRLLHELESSFEKHAKGKS